MTILTGPRLYGPDRFAQRPHGTLFITSSRIQDSPWFNRTAARRLLRDCNYIFRKLFFPWGTFAPDLRASESPMAMACLRLFTFLPERPLFKVPRTHDARYLATRTFLFRAMRYSI